MLDTAEIDAIRKDLERIAEDIRNTARGIPGDSGVIGFDLQSAERSAFEAADLLTDAANSLYEAMGEIHEQELADAEEAEREIDAQRREDALEARVV